MNKVKFDRSKSKIRNFILAMFLMAFLASAQVASFTSNGSGKTFDFGITSGKNANISSSAFRAYSVIGGIIGAANSSSFKAELGLLRALPYLDGESCQTGLECAGAFCCSNKCRSAACPVEAPESSSSAAGAASSGSGGGGGGELLVEDFTIDKEFIKALIKQGSTYQDRFSIRNTGNVELLFDVDYSALRGFMLLSDVHFKLAPKQSKDIEVTIFASEEEKPDLYSGNIVVKGNNIKKSLPVVIDVQAKKALFDIIVKVFPEHRNVLKTETVKANITLINLGDLKPVDAHLFYSIKDIEGNNLTFGFETLAVYNRISAVKELELPSNTQFGAYIFYAKVSYGADAAVAGDVFNVVISKPASCFDGIKNQDEEEADCGGACLPCKRKLADLFSAILPFIAEYGLYIIITILLIIIIILMYMLLKRKQGKTGKKEDEAARQRIKRLEEEMKKQEQAEAGRREGERLRQEAEARQKEEGMLRRQKEAEERRRADDEKRKQEELLRQKELEAGRREEEERLRKESQRKQKELEEKQKRAERERALAARKRKVKAFLHRIGLYKTAEEKRQVALRKEKERQERQRKGNELKKQNELNKLREEAERKKKEEEEKRQKEAEYREKNEDSYKKILQELSKKENEAREINLKFEDLSKERQQLAAELSKLRSGRPHNPIFSAIDYFFKKKFRKMGKKQIKLKQGKAKPKAEPEERAEIKKAIEEYKKTADRAKEAVKSRDISTAGRLYIKAREMYTGLPNVEKKAVYHDLLALYGQIAQANKKIRTDSEEKPEKEIFGKHGKEEK